MGSLLPKYLSLVDLKKLLDAPYSSNIRDRLILRLMANIGLRVSEVVGLKRKHFRFDEEKLLVTGKGKKQRMVPLTHPELYRLAQQYTRDMEPNDLLFDLERQSINALVNRYAKRAEIHIKVNPHMLRHSYAVFSIKQGMDIRNLQKILGHSSLNNTAIYLDLTREDIIESSKNHQLPY